MKIAIEGMDGVGKSTVARRMAEEFNMVYLEKPILNLFINSSGNEVQLFNDVCHNIYNLDNEILKAWFFGLGNLYSFLEYANQDIIVDRHFVSNYFWNGTERSNAIYQTMINLIGVPDITIVLYAPWKVREERIRNRNMSDPDLTDEEKKVDGYDKMYKFLDDFSIPYCVVDTENKDVDEVTSTVAQIISDYKTKNKVLERKKDFSFVKKYEGK